MADLPVLRRTIAILLLSGALAYAIFRGAETGNWISWELAGVLCAAIGLDGVNRTIEKIKGAAQHVASIIQRGRPDQSA